MHRILTCGFAALLIGLGSWVRAQQDVKITNTSIEVIHNDVHISYDLENRSGDETFYVWIEITDNKGNQLLVNALRGDIGYRVKGVGSKKIIWDPGADSIFLDTMLYVQVFADQSHNELQFNRTGLIFQSLAFPGLGLSRTSGNIHLIKGISAYACLSGSIVFNRLAVATYRDYGGADNPQEAEELLQTTRSQRRISQALAFTAAGIWVTDLVWTVAGTSNLKKPSLLSEYGVRVGSSFNHSIKTPLLQITYTF